MKKLLLTLLILSLVFEAFPQQQDSTTVYGALSYRNIGPTRGGRVTTVAGTPNDPGTFYMGATGGGVWKTVDYGHSWKNISDGYFATPSIGAIRVAPSNHEVIYVGTGSDGIRSNVIPGKGVYKSTDEGKSWSFVGLKDVGQIGAVEIHPENPDVVFVAAIGNAFGPGSDRGVYRSTNGGADWEKVLFISDSTGASDLEFAPDDPNTIYAGMWRGQRKPWTIISGSAQEGGVYKSTDGGTSWTKKSTGLPEGLIGKIDFAVSPANPNRVWALIEAPQGEGGVFKSDDRGETWTLVNTQKQLLDRPFYYCNIDVNPMNAETIYVNSTAFWKSSDGGKKFSRLSTPHGDNHDMWISPSDSLLFVQGNDGGANVTRDGGKTWSSILNQSTAELYQVEVDDQFPYWLYAGQQDNSTIAVPSTPPYSPPGGMQSFWRAVGGCETGPAVPKPGNPNIVYSNCKGRFGVYDKTTGQERQYYVGAANMYGHNPAELKYRFQRVSPIHVSQHNPDVIYHTSQFVHKSTNDGQTWEIISPDLTAFTEETQVISGSPITRDITGEEFYSTIYAIRESPVEEGTLWVGANDGPIHITRDGGQSWSNVTPQDLSPGGRVDGVEPSPHNAEKGYFAAYRYLLNDHRPYIYRTNDSGKSWTLLTTGENGIPGDYPTRVIREDPVVEGLLYAGTDYGMFISFDDGDTWNEFQQNLPVTPITDIKIHRGDLVLSTMGRGFWIMDDIALLRESKGTPPDQVTFFTPSTTTRSRHRSTGSKSIPHYPAAGVTLDFYLPYKTDDVGIRIYNEEDRLVRSFTTASKPQQGASSNMGLNLEATRPEAKLKTVVGANRFSWDLKHSGAYRADKGRPLQGPMVAPGEYRVELQVADENYTQNVMVQTDPRVTASGISDGDLKIQETLALSVRDLISEARKLEEQVLKRREELKERIDSGKANKRILAEDKALETLQVQLTTQEGRYMKPMLIDQLSYLYFMLLRADQLPGQDAVDRYNELSQLFEGIKTANEKLIGNISSR